MKKINKDYFFYVSIFKTGGTMEKHWTDTLTEEQTTLMKVASGFIDDASKIMEIITKNMDEKTKQCVILGYIATMGKALGMDLEAVNEV